MAYPLGFSLNAIPTRVKKAGLDLAVIVSKNPCTAAGVFTTNSFAAAPVQVSKQILQNKRIQALVINSGCANACTGQEGLANAWEMSHFVDRHCQANGTLVMSTGVIGQQLQMEKIKRGIIDLSNILDESPLMWESVAKAIMTTDTFHKLASNECQVASGQFRLAGVAKGAGMIHPNMATMLSAIFTDAYVSQECLDRAVADSVECSFNSITVDGDTSTNDSFIVMANGASQVRIEDVNSDEYKVFAQNLKSLSTDLAKLIVRDGEGATKFVTVEVMVLYL
jgi:glutamate N-acetyltransferase/amino-acid N-acetyltransferase